MSSTDEFREILKQRARGPSHLDPLPPELCERAMALILDGRATPAQIAGFLLVGRAAGDEPAEIAAYTRAMQDRARTIEPPPRSPLLTVTGGFDGKVRTFNVGAAASLVAAAAGARVLLLGCEGTPPKTGRTVFETLRNLGMDSPHALDEAETSLSEHGFAATTPQHYLPELHALLGLRWEIARRTVLSVAEKMVSPVPGTRFMIGVSHRPFLESILKALMDLGVRDALVFQAIEGSDEAPLDGNSSLVRVRDGESKELRVDPVSLGLQRATKSHIPWRGPEDESGRILSALRGEDGSVRDLILYNAALRLWMSEEDISEQALVEHLEAARETLESGAVERLLRNMTRLVPAMGT